MNNYIIKLRKLFKKIGRFSNLMSKPVENLFPLRPELPLPPGVSEKSLFDILNCVRVEDAPPQEMENYCRGDFRRFVYTYGLVQGLSGKCLELGANPYFTTILLQEFTNLKLVIANYFGSHVGNSITQKVTYKDVTSGEIVSTQLNSSHFNIESDKFPFEDDEFDVVLFCEIIEHLLVDPAAVIKEIKRILKPNGVLILTTPNVSRLENVARMISGANIYDPYSSYGPYGRHNREYNKHELYLLLNYLGFSIEKMFSADVHANSTSDYCSVNVLASLLKKREFDLGQYIFVKAINTDTGGNKKPSFLYRSYPADELE